jgi:hypothetical protein
MVKTVYVAERCPHDARVCTENCYDKCKRKVRGDMKHQLSRTKTYGRGWPTLITTDGTRELNHKKPHFVLRAGPDGGYFASFMSGYSTQTLRVLPWELWYNVEKRLRAHGVLA